MQPLKVFCEERGVPKNFVNFIGKHLLMSLFLVAGIQTSNFIKKILHHSCFSVKFTKIFNSTYFEEHQRTTDSKNCLYNSLKVNVSQYSYITENEWTHPAVFRFIFNMLLKKTLTRYWKKPLAGLRKRLK